MGLELVLGIINVVSVDLLIVMAIKSGWTQESIHLRWKWAHFSS